MWHRSYRIIQTYEIMPQHLSFYNFPHVIDHIETIGWECLVSFKDKFIYPGLIVKFYSNMIVNRDMFGTVTSIIVCSKS